jgi:regulator of protease activity HflC (stomatin/prohibitin superfamily)
MLLLNNALVLIPVVILLIVVMASVRVLREYERAVVFQLGRFWKVKGPGLILVIPVLQQAVRVDMPTAPKRMGCHHSVRSAACRRPVRRLAVDGAVR